MNSNKYQEKSGYTGAGLFVFSVYPVGRDTAGVGAFDFAQMKLSGA